MLAPLDYIAGVAEAKAQWGQVAVLVQDSRATTETKDSSNYYTKIAPQNRPIAMKKPPR
jgi:hypothetical protein